MSDAETNDLKEYLLGEFEDSRYVHKSIIDIYMMDRKYFDALLKRQLIRGDVVAFFECNEVNLRNCERISIEAFRKIKYEQIIDEYVKNGFKNTLKKTPTKDNVKKRKCYVYGVLKVPKCKKKSCPGWLEDCYISVKKKNKNKTRKALRCFVCGTYYLKYDVYRSCRNKWTCINSDELQEIQIEVLHQRKLDKTRKKSKKNNSEESSEQKISLSKEELAKLPKISQQELKLAELKLKMIKDNIQNKEQRHYHDNNIGVKDFVVRRNTFKCLHKDHQLENVDAVLGVISKNSDVIQIKVPAGYCPQCNIFFIMESTYQDIKMKGIPVCRMSDEKTYLNSTYVNGMMLAQESILMQYGYSVSQEEGLSATTRRKILAVLVDNKVLTRSDIISYLDFFINQRKYQPKFEKAIDKWESDREFISEYKTGDYLQLGINGIYRKY